LILSKWRKTMSLSSTAIDRIFSRLAAAYGKQFFELYAQVDPSDVKTAWCHELDVFSTPNGFKRIAWALDNLPDRTPNLLQFRNLCRAAPAPDVPPLPMPEANPARMREELAKLGHVTGLKLHTTTGAMDWAPRILARHAAGAKITPTVMGMAREVDAMRVRRAA
jgi:hypothetical protein